MKQGGKRGQVTIFIILAIIIVAAVLVFFLYVQPNYFQGAGKKLYLETCIEKEIQDSVKQLSLSAGVLNSEFTTMYLDQNITFICYTDEYYKPCVVQQPFLKQTFEKSLKSKLDSKIKACYDGSISQLRSQGYGVQEGTMNYSLEITPTEVVVLISAPTTISNAEINQRINNFAIRMPSEIYTILSVASSILQYETSYGDTDTSSFMFYYPDLNVQKIRRDNGVKIYIVSDKKDIKFKFATRSFAWPPGYGLTN